MPHVDMTPAERARNARNAAKGALFLLAILAGGLGSTVLVVWAIGHLFR